MMIISDRYMRSFDINAGVSPGVNVFWGKDLETSRMVLIRQEPAASKYRLLDQEADIYNALGSSEGFPLVCWHGAQNEDRYIIQEFIGTDLEHYALSDFVSLKTAKVMANYAAQMLERVRTLHTAGRVHRDLKPTSFAVRRNIYKKDVQQVCLLNFGMCQRISGGINGSASTNIGRDFLFASANTLRNGRPSKRDDIESLAYTFVWLLKHELPWEHLKDNNGFEGRQEAIACRQDPKCQESLRENLPEVFANFVAYAISLDSAAEPDYERWSRQFKEYAASSTS